ncbi:hypothetical protein ACLEPN_29585 [Myxococcus sp. 1LA]
MSSIVSAVESLRAIEAGTKRVMERRTEWAQSWERARALVERTMATINEPIVERDPRAVGLIIKKVKSRWDDQAAFGVGLSTEFLGLSTTEVVKDGPNAQEDVVLKSLGCDSATLTFAPGVHGMIRVVYRAAQLELGGIPMGVAPKEETIASLEPKEMLSAARVEDLLATFLSRVVNEHWTKHGDGPVR